MKESAKLPDINLIDVGIPSSKAIRETIEDTCATSKFIQSAPVKRDINGLWTHPDIPDFDEDLGAWEKWREAQELELSISILESEDDTHPAYINYFENDSEDISMWNPTPPLGEGWFTFSIHDSDDGPVYVWARRV